MKRIIARETLLVYPDFKKPFIVHTDASHIQLGAVISQDNKPIAFYSRKLNPAQQRYTTTERELLSIVETLKEFRNILLGQRIKVYTDHKNLTYTNFNTERVMRWRLIIEEYSPELIYLKGQTNIVADALSRLELATPEISNEEMHDMHYLADNFGLEDDDLPEDVYPLQYKLIATHQNKQKDLFIKLNKKQDGFHLKSFCGGGKKRTLICRNEKIIIPKTLQRRVVTWYHDILCHSGETRTEQTLRQQFWWPNLRNDVHDVCSKCDTCQRTKRTTQKYGKLPPKEAEADPWEILCVDLIGPYTIKRRGKKNLTLWCVTMIDPATGWFEMREIPNKEALTVANLVEQTWFTRYPWPNQIIFDRGKEFMGEFARMVEKDYGIKRKPTTTRNPQANSVIERIHQTIGNIIRSFQIGQIEIDEQDPWSGVLAATMFATRATYHTTTQATPSQLVFGRDAILNIKFDANWKLIRERKQRAINENNQMENKKRIPHNYRVGDKVLYRVEWVSKYNENPYDGPYKIVQVNTNGTVRLKKGAVTDTVNIRLLKPYRE
jgi:transposase InsO family protein